MTISIMLMREHTHSLCYIIFSQCLKWGEHNTCASVTSTFDATVSLPPQSSRLLFSQSWAQAWWEGHMWRFLLLPPWWRSSWESSSQCPLWTEWPMVSGAVETALLELILFNLRLNATHPTVRQLQSGHISQDRPRSNETCTQESYIKKRLCLDCRQIWFRHELFSNPISGADCPTLFIARVLIGFGSIQTSNACFYVIWDCSHYTCGFGAWSWL